MEQKKSRAAEIIRFALTGGVCFVVELAVLILLKGKFGVDTLIATPIAFLISVILNYLGFPWSKEPGSWRKGGLPDYQPDRPGTERGADAAVPGGSG